MFLERQRTGQEVGLTTPGHCRPPTEEGQGQPITGDEEHVCSVHQGGDEDSLAASTRHKETSLGPGEPDPPEKGRFLVVQIQILFQPPQM